MNRIARCGLLLLGFIACDYFTHAQESNPQTSSVQRILGRIEQLQVSRDSYFHPGMFPAYREYSIKKGRMKNDENIFYTAIIIYTLRSLQPYLDSGSKKICDSIFFRAAANYPRYKNTKGRPSYNFWRKDRPEIFPNSGWLNLFNKSKALPDDLDDTAIMAMAAAHSQAHARKVHLLMQAYTNSKPPKSNKRKRPYGGLQAYRTWFGEKMPVEVDVCVLTNALLMVHAFDMPYTSADSASLQFITRVVAERDYITDPASVSANYSRTPVIIYHISRLMADRLIPALEALKPQLIEDTRKCYSTSKNMLDKILLSTSLLRWGVKPPRDTIHIQGGLLTHVENKPFVFFIANIAASLPSPLNALLRQTGLCKFNYYSPAWNDTLLLENLILAGRPKL